MDFIQSEEFQEKKTSEISNGRANKLAAQDRAFHDWYRFVLSFPPHLVRDYLSKFELNKNSVVLDPFCGTGTTVVESKLAGMKAIGLEGNLFPHFASSVKTSWNLNADLLASKAQIIATETLEVLKSQGIDDNFPFEKEMKDLKTISEEAQKLILTNSISPLPLHKSLTLLEAIEKHKGELYYRHLLLALGNALVFKISNLHFGPEVGVRKPKIDTPVISNWLFEVEKMAKDLRQI